MQFIAYSHPSGPERFWKGLFGIHNGPQPSLEDPQVVDSTNFVDVFLQLALKQDHNQPQICGF